jgi:hypothetical protein
MVVSSLGFIFASYISHWKLEKQATQKRQEPTWNKKAKEKFSLWPKDEESHSLHRSKAFSLYFRLSLYLKS